MKIIQPLDLEWTKISKKEFISVNSRLSVALNSIVTSYIYNFTF